MPGPATQANLPQVALPPPLRSWNTQSDFKVSKEPLTKGSYGKVYLAWHHNTAQELIVKVSAYGATCSVALVQCLRRIACAPLKAGQHPACGGLFHTRGLHSRGVDGFGSLKYVCTAPTRALQTSYHLPVAARNAVPSLDS